MEKPPNNKATQQPFVDEEQTTTRHDSPFNAVSGPDADDVLLPALMDFGMDTDMDIELDPALERELFGSPPRSPEHLPESGSTVPNESTTGPAPKEAVELPDSTKGIVDGADDGTVISQPNNIDFQESQTGPTTGDGGSNSTNATTQMDIDHPPSAAQLNSVQQSQANPFAGAAVAAQGLMPPAAAPASMLTQLRPSSNAKTRINDPFFICRLISACVILFRLGRAGEAQKLGQFTIDLAGQRLWDEELPTYLKAPPLAEDSIDSAQQLLREAVKCMRQKYWVSSDFLDGMLYAWS